MIKKIINFLKRIWFRNQKIIVMENLSSLEAPQISLDFLNNSNILYNENKVEIKAYIFNSVKNSLEKVKFDFNYDLIDILNISPWGIIGLNSKYQTVSLRFVESGIYLMNTNDFPLEVMVNNLPFKWEKNVLNSDSPIEVNIKPTIEVLKEKTINYPVFNENYLNYNKNFFSEKEFQNLFLQIFSQPIESLNQSLEIFDQHLKTSERRTFGHRWSLNSNYYYSESKISSLDQSNLKNHQEWNNHMTWDNGQIAIVDIVSAENILLIEVIAIGPEYIWAVDRQLACSLLKNHESLEQCLLKAQIKIPIKNIKKSYLIKN